MTGAATRLSVNLNAVALLRNRRGLPWPSVTGLGAQALAAGAHGLTVHPRPDQRHVRFCDLPALRALILDTPGDGEFNVEGYPSEDFLRLVEANRPDQVTLVPDAPDQATSDHGWDFRRDHGLLAPVAAWLKERGMRVSLFADGDGDAQAMERAAAIGADRVELYTGPYAACFDDPAGASRALDALAASAGAAQRCGLGVNAGHDLTVANLPALREQAPGLREVSIGHGLTADALTHGMAGSVRRFLEACGHAAPASARA